MSACPTRLLGTYPYGQGQARSLVRELGTGRRIPTYELLRIARNERRVARQVDEAVALDDPLEARTLRAAGRQQSLYSDLQRTSPAARRDPREGGC